MQRQDLIEMGPHAGPKRIGSKSSVVGSPNFLGSVVQSDQKLFLGLAHTRTNSNESCIRTQENWVMHEDL